MIEPNNTEMPNITVGENDIGAPKIWNNFGAINLLIYLILW